MIDIESEEQTICFILIPLDERERSVRHQTKGHDQSLP